MCPGEVATTLHACLWVTSCPLHLSLSPHVRIWQQKILTSLLSLHIGVANPLLSSAVRAQYEQASVLSGGHD